MHNNFDFEKLILIKDKNGNKVKFYMRPLKVKELATVNKIIELQEEQRAWSEILPFFILLIQEAIDTELQNDWYIEDLVEAFVKLNFDDYKSKEKELADKKKKIQDLDSREELAKAIDFLMSQGHAYKDIFEYTIPQLILFQKVALERIFGKSSNKIKTRSPLEVLSKIGIPLERKK